MKSIGKVRGRDVGLQNDKRYGNAHRDHHSFMMYSTSILIARSTGRKTSTLARRRNSRPIRCVVVLCPISIRPTSIPQAIIITIVVRGIKEIIGRANHRKRARKLQSQPQQQVARHVGAGVDGAIAHEQGRDVGHVPNDGESEGDVLPRQVDAVAGEVVVFVVIRV